MAKRTIWFINEYAGSPYHGMVFRHYYLGRELANLGYKIWIVSANYSHLFLRYPTSEMENIDGINYLWVKVVKYPHAHSKKRVFKWFQFSSKLFVKLKNLPKPDYIYVSSPFLLPIIPAYFYSKKYKAKLIFEVRDIWPLTLVELGNYSWKHPFIRFLREVEMFALRRADKLVSVLPSFGKYLEELNIKREWIYIPNGINLKSIKEGELPPSFTERIRFGEKHQNRRN